MQQESREADKSSERSSIILISEWKFDQESLNSVYNASRMHEFIQ